MVMGNPAWTFSAIDHVQLAMPPGEEEQAEHFYRDVLGFAVVQKPPALAARGGRWFEQGGVHVHLGVEADFRPARKAHPAFVVAPFEPLLSRLEAAGVAIEWADEGPGVRRGHIADCFGNRMELIDPGTATVDTASGH
jgi:catechol 2,3-dioxygenase-like lactoylglutathione lyase family enzyme